MGVKDAVNQTELTAASLELINVCLSVALSKQDVLCVSMCANRNFHMTFHTNFQYRISTLAVQ